MSPAQERLILEIRNRGGCDEYGAEYWPTVNDWVNDAGPAKALALRNINRTVAALLKRGIITIDDCGCFHVVAEKAGKA